MIDFFYEFVFFYFIRLHYIYAQNVANTIIKDF